jgi:hypothetical protein
MEDEGKDSPEQAALKECAMRIGLFFTYWGRIERCLTEVFAYLLKTDRGRAFLVFNEYSSLGVKFKLMRRLLHALHTDSAERKALFRLIGDTQKLSDTRNLYAHGSLGLETADDNTQRVVIVPGTPPNDVKTPIAPFKPITPAAIQAELNIARGLGERWTEFLQNGLPKLDDLRVLERLTNVVQGKKMSTNVTGALVAAIALVTVAVIGYWGTNAVAARRERIEERARLLDVKRAARLIDMELLYMDTTLALAIQKRRYWELPIHAKLGLVEWEKYRTLIATELPLERWTALLIASEAARDVMGTYLTHLAGQPMSDQAVAGLEPMQRDILRGREALRTLTADR